MAGDDGEDGSDVLLEPPEYGNPEYWEQHFASAPHGKCNDPSSLEFEWVHSDLGRLVEMLLPELPSCGRLLHPGCGMSVLPVRLHAAGCELAIASLDTSRTCVEAMRSTYGHMPGLTWDVQDGFGAGVGRAQSIVHRSVLT